MKQMEKITAANKTDFTMFNASVKPVVMEQAL